MTITNLSLLTFLEEKYSTYCKQPFRDYACIFIQHLLGSNLSLIQSLERGGLEKEKLYIIGKAYSSNIDVLKFLKKHGYHYNNPSLGYSIDTCYDEILKTEIRKTISYVLSNYEGPILLLDDAAKGISIIHEEPFIKYISRFKCIELTTRGIRELKKIDVACPVVDIASSFVKRNIESIIIAESMVNNFFHFLNAWKDFYHPINNNILLIGYGAIGQKVCKKMSSQYNITVYDIDDKACKKACDNRIRVTQDITDQHYGIIIGCTGLSIKLEQLLNYSRTLFINMSSSDLEFGLWRFAGHKELMRIRKNAITIKEKPFHEFYYIKNNDNEVYIANGGFPIDFNGDIDPIHPDKIQITRALVFAAAIQALTEVKRGLISLNSNIQQELINKYLI